MAEQEFNPAVVIEQNGYQMPSQLQRNYMYITYFMYGVGAFFPLTLIVGVVLAYLKRDEMQGTIYYEHMQFLIKTFWVLLIGMIIGTVLAVVVIGFLIILAVGIWYVFRVVVGIVKVLENKPVTPNGWLM